MLVRSPHVKGGKQKDNVMVVGVTVMLKIVFYGKLQKTDNENVNGKHNVVKSTLQCQDWLARSGRNVFRMLFRMPYCIYQVLTFFKSCLCYVL